MKYKTVIEIVTEARDSHDAADIAGEYLRNAIDTGVKMSCVTKPFVRLKGLRIALFSFVLLFALSATTFTINKRISFLPIPSRSVSAVQPPLKNNSLNDSFANHSCKY